MINISEIPKEDEKYLLKIYTQKELKILKEDNNYDGGGHLVIYRVKDFYEYMYNGNYCTRIWTARDFWDRYNGVLRDGFGHDFWYDNELSEKRGEETFIDENGVIMYSEQDLEYSKGVKPLCLY